jgi:hypothetical protein
MIMVFPIQRRSTLQSGIGIHHPQPVPYKTQKTLLRLGRDGYPIIIIFGTIAQKVEHLVEAQGATGSIPVRTTESRNNGRPPLPHGSQSNLLVKWGKRSGGNWCHSCNGCSQFPVMGNTGSNPVLTTVMFGNYAD